MEHDAISEKIAEKHATINIDKHEIEIFLLIFHLLLEANTDLTKEEETDNTGGVPNIILTITNRLVKFLQDNIDSLNIADILKGVLQRNIEHFLKKLKEENLGIPEMKQLKNTFFKIFQPSVILIFVKI